MALTVQLCRPAQIPSIMAALFQDLIRNSMICSGSLKSKALKCQRKNRFPRSPNAMSILLRWLSFVPSAFLRAFSCQESRKISPRATKWRMQTGSLHLFRLLKPKRREPAECQQQAKETKSGFRGCDIDMQRYQQSKGPRGCRVVGGFPKKAGLAWVFLQAACGFMVSVSWLLLRLRFCYMDSR